MGLGRPAWTLFSSATVLSILISVPGAVGQPSTGLSFAIPLSAASGSNADGPDVQIISQGLSGLNVNDPAPAAAVVPSSGTVPACKLPSAFPQGVVGATAKCAPNAILQPGESCPVKCAPNTSPPPGSTATTSQYLCQTDGKLKVPIFQFYCIPNGCAASQRPTSPGQWVCDKKPTSAGLVPHGAVCTRECPADQYGATLTSTCSFGQWSGPATTTCSACVPIANSQGDISCTTASNSKAGEKFSCNPGFFLVRGPADSCRACTAIANSRGPVTCTSAADSRGSAGFACNPGFFLVSTGQSDVCQACPSIANGVGSVTCTSSANSKASPGFNCKDGFYLDRSGTADACRPCTPITNAANNLVTCSFPTNSVAAPGFQCKPGYTYQPPRPGSSAGVCQDLDCPANAEGTRTNCKCVTGFFGTLTLSGSTWTGTCQACRPVADSVGQVTCSSASDSRVTGCQAGYYRAPGVTGKPDLCLPCSAIANGQGARTCSAATNSKASTGFTCNRGYYLKVGVPADTCEPCVPIANGRGPVACTNPTNTQSLPGFVCNAGRYLKSGTADTCEECTPIDNSSGSITCRSPTTSQAGQGFRCDPGFYLDGGAADKCLPCEKIDNGDGPITCTSSSTTKASTGFRCDIGFYLKTDVADTCEPCTPIPYGSGLITCGGPSGTSALFNFKCDTGFYLNRGANGDTCESCSPIENGSGPITCTSAEDTQAGPGFKCDPGTYLDKTNSDDRCTACTPIDKSANNKITCTGPEDSVASVGFQCQRGYAYRGPQAESTSGFCQDLDCPVFSTGSKTNCECREGYWGDLTLVGEQWNGECQACEPVDNSAGQVTCTASSDSRVTECEPGFYLIRGGPGVADRCQACTPIGNGKGDISCTNAQNSQAEPGFDCNLGFYLKRGQADTCQRCPSIANGNGSVTCSSPTDTRAGANFKCISGFYLNVGLEQDTCEACTPIRFSTGPITCTDAFNSVPGPGFSCNRGLSYLPPRVGMGSGRAGGCMFLGCPDNANGQSGFECKCNPGYAGTLTPPTDTGKWTGTCNAVPCPANADAVGYPSSPSCVCRAPTYAGVISWSGTAWTGSCINCGCQNDGVCQAKGICTCPTGFYGDQCEDIAVRILGGTIGRDVVKCSAAVGSNWGLCAAYTNREPTESILLRVSSASFKKGAAVLVRILDQPNRCLMFDGQLYNVQCADWDNRLLRNVLRSGVTQVRDLNGQCLYNVVGVEGFGVKVSNMATCDSKAATQAGNYMWKLVQV